MGTLRAGRAGLTLCARVTFRPLDPLSTLRPHIALVTLTAFDVADVLPCRTVPRVEVRADHVGVAQLPCRVLLLKLVERREAPLDRKRRARRSLGSDVTLIALESLRTLIALRPLRALDAPLTLFSSDALRPLEARELRTHCEGATRDCRDREYLAVGVDDRVAHLDVRLGRERSDRRCAARTQVDGRQAHGVGRRLCRLRCRLRGLRRFARLRRSLGRLLRRSVCRSLGLALRRHGRRLRGVCARLRRLGTRLGRLRHLLGVGRRSSRSRRGISLSLGVGRLRSTCRLDRLDLSRTCRVDGGGLRGSCLFDLRLP